MASREQKMPSTKLDSATKKGFTTAFLLDLFIWAIWVVYIGKLPPEVPLWYSLPYGTALLAAKEGLVIIPGIATLGVLLNLFLVWWWRKLEPVLMALIAWSSMLVALLMLIALIHIIILVL